MILQYFKIKENEYKKITDKIYVSILTKSKELIKNEFFIKKSFDTSFEIISIILVFYLKEFKDINKPEYKTINDLLMKNFINDLDQTFRENGIGDMSIGKYVKKYVKKFYYRIKIIDPILKDFDEVKFKAYLNSLDFTNKEHTPSIITNFKQVYEQIKKNHHIV
jgi:cytochrome b pre-mRNA-processing protein 3